MGYLVESERTLKLMSENSSGVLLVHYFFYELGESQEKSFGGLLHAIVHQLLVGFHTKKRATLSLLYELLKPYLSSDLTLRDALPNQVLVRILRKLVAQCQEPLRVYLFIDGFDECHGDHREQMDTLIDLVRSSSDKTLSVRACIASRYEMEIQLRLSNEPTIAIHQFTGEDISAYVKDELRKAWDLMDKQPDGTTALYDSDLVDKVTGKAQGVFVWVQIVVSQLALAIEEEAELCDLYSLLDDFPKGLEDLYSSILGKIDQKLWPDTVNFLRLLRVPDPELEWQTGYIEDNLLILSCAIQDPMSAVTCKASVDEGFTIDDASLPHNQCAQVKRRLQRSCRGFIEIVDLMDNPISNSLVHLLHLTAREYLSGSQTFKEMLDKVDKRSLRDPAVAKMAMWLRFLKCYPQEWNRDFLIRTFFAATSSAERSTAVSQTAYVEELDRVLSLLDPDWTASYSRSREMSTGPTLAPDILSLAVYYGLAFYLEHQIGTNGKGMIQGAKGRPLLFYAVDGLVTETHHDRRTSFFNTFEVLLNNGADPMQTFEGRTPWSRLVTKLNVDLTQEEHANPLRLMLKHGADPSQRVSIKFLDDKVHFELWPEEIKNKQYTTTFHMLLFNLRHLSDANKATVELMVDHCNDLDATDSDGIGIQEWADSINPEMGAFLRQEIAAKKRRKRRRKH